ncbi:MAG TPA: hypothetical protein VGV59_13890 [Pyrinomonadaceae bacterium]|nr:hypothetical protein [Pyrinomonadaceae bacterium]
MILKRTLAAVTLLFLLSHNLTAQMSATASISEIDTTALDAKITRAVARADAPAATRADKKAAAKAYFERADIYRDAGNPRLYRFALGDYRRGLRYDPTNADARAKMDEIVSIYQSMRRPVPTNGLEEAATNASTSPQVSAEPASQNSQAKRIRFRRGRNSATVTGAIVVGSAGDEYLIGARAGQRIALSITSPEKNAVFDLYKVRPEEPGEIVLEKQSWNGVLKEEGDYLIRVGSVRGNAGYTLRVTIR